MSGVLHFRKSDAPFILRHIRFHCFPVQSLYPVVAKLGEPANQAGRVFQSTVEWIIYVHYKNNWVSKYPSCGALLAQCNIFIMNNQLKNSSCKAVLKCPFGETAGTSTVVDLLAKPTQKMDFTIHFRKLYVFTHSKSDIIYYLDCFNAWFDSKFLAEVPVQMLFHVCPGCLKIKLSGVGSGAPDLSALLQPSDHVRTERMWPFSSASMRICGTGKSLPVEVKGLDSTPAHWSTGFCESAESISSLLWRG